MEILHHARKVRLGNELQQPECGGIQRCSRNLAADQSARASEIARIGDRELQLRRLIAEISRPLLLCGNRGELVHGVAGPIAIEIHEEKCFVVTVVNAGNHQRAAEIAAETFAPGGNLRRIGLRERIGAGIQNRIAVLVINAGANAVYSLADDALHAVEGRNTLRWRASAARSGSPSRGSSKHHAGSAGASAKTARPATGPGKTGCGCAAGLSHGSATPEASARASETGLARIARPLKNDAAGRETSGKAGILIAAADGAVHKDGVRGGGFSERALVVRYCGRCGFRLLLPSVFLALIACLIIEG